HIDGQLDLMGATLTNDDGPALSAELLQVGSDAVLTNLTATTGRGEYGAVRLLGADIAGNLDLTDASLTNEDGPALSAADLQVGSDALLTNLKATGHGERGAVWLPGACIASHLDLRGATLTAEDGPALFAFDLQVGRDAVLADLEATGRSERGVVRLPGAHISGNLIMSGHVSIRGDERVILDLRNANVDTRFILWDAEFWIVAFGKPFAERPKVMLNGFTYRVQPSSPDTGVWLQVLRQCMPDYAPEPYKQLAEVCRTAGDEAQAKAVLIAQQDAYGKTLRQGDSRRHGARVWHWVSRVTVRYGYQPSRALWYLLAVLAVSCALLVVADIQGWLVHPSARGGGRCGIVESVGSALDRTVPLLGFGVAGRCELSNATPAQWIFAASLILQVLSWVFVTLFVAGFTGIVRKSGT
ncbi:hypothetical protein ACFU3E_12635, partial [Streptomyces sp. NPDC057424]|uniref:hypothetical protein n=1 Tax=Streptomyces sp. NPDC057424 TaxID=3346127 RepID=UPI0036A15A77